jgi:hypothetical protein
MYRRRVELRKRVITFVSGIVSSHALSLTENLHRVQKRGETTEKVANEERSFRDTIGIDNAYQCQYHKEKVEDEKVGLQKNLILPQSETRNRSAAQ